MKDEWSDLVKRPGEAFVQPRDLFDQTPRFYSADMRRAERELTFRLDTTDYIIAASLGIDASLVRMRRYIPVRIYLASPGLSGLTAANRFLLEDTGTAFANFLQYAGFEPADDSQPQISSLYWHTVRRTRFRKSSSELARRLTLIEATLGEAFTAVGAQTSFSDRDRQEMEQLRAETRKANADALKALSEAALNFAKLIVKVAASFAIIVGTIHVVGHPVEQNKSNAIQITIQKLSPEKAIELWQSDQFGGTAAQAVDQNPKSENDPLP
jgi:hypothetical protein